MLSLSSLSLQRAWATRPISIRSAASPSVASNRLRVQLVAPLKGIATQEGLYGNIGEGRVSLAWLQAQDSPWIRPRLRARFVLDGEATLLTGHFALPLPVRLLLGLAGFGLLFIFGTLLIGFLSDPRPELIFLLLIFLATVLLIGVAMNTMTTRFYELCDRLEEHVSLIISNPPRRNLPRRHVRLEVEKVLEERQSDSNRTA